MIYVKISDCKKSAKDWGIVSAKISRKNCANDSAELVFADYSQAPVVAADNLIEIFDENVRKFSGFLTQAPTVLSARKRKFTILAKNAWNELEQIVYQQSWCTASDTQNTEVTLTNVLRSKVVLGQNSEGVRINIAAQITNILNYAIECGAKFQLGNIDANSQMLLEEATDISCADAISRVLRWLPNTQVFFDYSVDGLPSINVIERKNLQQIQLSENCGALRKLNLCARNDILVKGVVIKYEQKNTSGDSVWRTLIEDVYPPQTSAKSKNVIVMSVELAGLKENVQVMRLTCKTIEPESKIWWTEQLGFLKKIGVDSFEILESSREWTSLPRQLISGNIQDYMSKNVKLDTICATVKITDQNGTQVKQRVSVTVKATDATTGIYPKWSMTYLPEEVPTLLAKNIYESVNELLYEGDFEILNMGAENFIGKKISIVLADGKTACAPVVSASENLSNGVTTVKFGPPKHLYASDIAEFFRINRNRKVPAQFGNLKSGKCISSQVELGGDSPESASSQFVPQYMRIVLEEESVPSINVSPRIIDIDCADLDEEELAIFRRVLVLKNGKVAYANVLMTDPKEETITNP